MASSPIIVAPESPPKLYKKKSVKILESHVPSDYVAYVLNDKTEKTWVKPKKNDKCVQHNSFCEVCNATVPVSYGKSLVFCIYCNVVAHVKCMQKYQKNFSRHRNWVCYYCVDSLTESKGTFEHERKRAERLRAQILAQILIAKYFRKYLARKYYLTIYIVIVKLQIMFRVRQRKKHFLLKRQMKLRIMKVKINFCIDLIPKEKIIAAQAHSPTNSKMRGENYFYILVTVMDTMKYSNIQTWKIQSEVVYTLHTVAAQHKITFDDTILLPGVSGFQFIVLTVFQKGQSRDLFLGQTSVDLSQHYYWKRGGHFAASKLHDQEFPIKDYIGLEMKSEYRFPPKGTIDFELIPCHNMASECGLVYGTCIEDLIRFLHQLPDFAGYSQPSTQVTSPVATKKKGYGGLSASPEFFNIPMKKIWIAIVDGTMFVYPHYTDPLKLIVHLEFFTPSTEIKNKAIIYKLHRPGYPMFSFSTVSTDDALRWKTAFICSTKYKQFAKEKPDFMSLLITDMLKIEDDSLEQIKQQEALALRHLHNKDNNNNYHNNSKINIRGSYSSITSQDSNGNSVLSPAKRLANLFASAVAVAHKNAHENREYSDHQSDNHSDSNSHNDNYSHNNNYTHHTSDSNHDNNNKASNSAAVLPAIKSPTRFPFNNEATHLSDNTTDDNNNSTDLYSSHNKDSTDSNSDRKHTSYDSGDTNNSRSNIKEKKTNRTVHNSNSNSNSNSKSNKNELLGSQSDTKLRSNARAQRHTIHDIISSSRNIANNSSDSNGEQIYKNNCSSSSSDSSHQINTNAHRLKQHINDSSNTLQQQNNMLSGYNNEQNQPNKQIKHNQNNNKNSSGHGAPILASISTDSHDSNNSGNKKSSNNNATNKTRKKLTRRSLDNKPLPGEEASNLRKSFFSTAQALMAAADRVAKKLKDEVSYEYSVDDSITDAKYVSMGEHMTGNMLFKVAQKHLRKDVKSTIK